MRLPGNNLIDILFENPAVGISILYPDGAFQKGNHLFRHMLGYSETELQHIHLCDVAPDIPLQALLSENGTFKETLLIRKDGTSFAADIDFSGASADSDEPAVVLFLKESESTSHEAAAKLTRATLRSNELQRLLINLATKIVNIPIEKLNSTIQHALAEIGSFADVDRAYVFKYDLEGNTFSNTYEWCAPGISPEIENMQELPLEIIADIPHVHQAGKSYHVPQVDLLSHESLLYKLLYPQQIQTLVTVPMLSNGNCLGFIGFDSVKRIRQWKKEEISLLSVLAELLTNAENRRQGDLDMRESVDRFKGLFDLSPVGIVLNDFETGKFVEANQAFLKSTGYTIDELQHMMLEDLECAGPLFPERINRNGTYGPYEREMLRRNGSHMQVLQSGMQFCDKKGRRLLWSILQDFTEIKASQFQLEVALNANKKTNQELKAAIESAEEANRAKESFLANMSHEIRTPMNGILGISKMLSKTGLDPVQQNYLSIIRHSAKNLLVVINDILDLAKIQSGKLEIEQIPFDVQESLDTMHRLLHFKAEEKGIAFHVAPVQLENTLLVGDPYRLNQILLNLANNAIKFTDTGSVTISNSITKETADQLTIVFSVADTGIGIAENKLDKIFEGFAQAYSNTTRKHGGTGLGLSICKQLIEMQQGKLWVQSEIGRGSCFSFSLTFAKHAEKMLPVSGPENTDYSSLGKLRVLLAEDNEINAFLAQTLMESWGFQVELAANGREAIEKAERMDFDIILMDIQMPEVSGIEATRQIRKLPNKQKAGTPIIALTANALKGDDNKYLQAGMDDYISKPFEEEMLFSKIAALLTHVKA